VATVHDGCMTRRHALLLPFLNEKPEDLVWWLDKIRWQREEFGGARYAVIDGDREKPGEPFTYAFWMPPGVWVPAHTHSQQAHVAVLKGTLLLGFGKKLEKKKTRAIPAGQFFIVRAGVAHYEGCQEETLIIGSALGGWKTDMLE
jgi:mannose-6-phosphate isomerase-like protein (cupin superfamily)